MEIYVLMRICKIDAVPTSGCVCPGDTLSYECTIIGTETGATIWTGSALNDCSTNEIVLLHSYFNTGTYQTMSCNNGAIVARILSVEGNNYISQLNITVTPHTAGKKVVCLHYNLTHEMLIFSSIIPKIIG